jgi:hypothetical protein
VTRSKPPFSRVSRALCGAALALAALAACKGSSPAPSGGTASSAEVRWRDAGPAELAMGERVVALPSGELAEGAKPAIMQDDTAARLAFVRAAGDVRLAYVVGAGVYLGPVTKAPIDFKAAPDLDHALGSLFEAAGDRRAQLVMHVREAKGDAGVARMLIDGAGADGKEWDDAFAKLPEARATEVKTALATLLERGKPTAGLRRAVIAVPLREPARAPALAARIKELGEPVREPRATAVMLRALSAIDKPQAAQVACELLSHKPLETANAPPRSTPEELDPPGRELLVEAALLAIASAGTDCPHAATYLGDDLCAPAFRCNEQGPLTGRETTKQDEPLCTKEQLAQAITKELARSPADVASPSNGARPHLFAFATLVGAGKVPAALTTAHARRRYVLVQPATPECESGVAPGTPCHCEEAILRDQTCRHPDGSTVSVGVCKFRIDDKQTKITDVVGTPPP